MDRIQIIANKLHKLIDEENINELEFINATDEVRIQLDWSIM